MPSATSILGYAFDGCTALKTANIPMASGTPVYGFRGCTALEKVFAQRSTTIGNYGFQGCSSLTAIIIRDFDSVDLTPPVSIGALAFGGTPMLPQGSGGYFYAPSASIEAFKDITAWKSYYNAGKFRAIEDYPGVLD